MHVVVHYLCFPWKNAETFFFSISHFSGPDWGNAAQVNTVGLRSQGLINAIVDLQKGHLMTKTNLQTLKGDRRRNGPK